MGKHDLILAPGESEYDYVLMPGVASTIAGGVALQAQRRIGWDACLAHLAAQDDTPETDVPEGFVVADNSYDGWVARSDDYWFPDTECDYASEDEAIAACHEHKRRVQAPVRAKLELAEQTFERTYEAQRERYEKRIAVEQRLRIAELTDQRNRLLARHEWERAEIEWLKLDDDDEYADDILMAVDIETYPDEMELYEAEAR